MSPVPALSVIICTHNPDRTRLERTLGALRAQTLPAEEWETIVVDNASRQFPDAGFFTAHAPKNSVLVDEKDVGLAFARKRGFSAARGYLAVLVDDDNVLESHYLAEVLALAAQNPTVGTFGGKSLPEFESKPEPWQEEFLPLLALRDPGEMPEIARSLRPDPSGRNVYPLCAPIGAGMAIRREAWQSWVQRPAALVNISDRRGADLSSAGDNDIVLCALRAGWGTAYFPSLRLHHLIPATRLMPGYLARLNRSIQKSWMQVLTLHEANPWPPLSPASAALRKTKAWFTYAAWRPRSPWIRWQGACGHFDGRVRSHAA
jgi:cellulose synthase/poly-beta-1,6-N-acetylglucosamine synthase-like glycosyltransferase